MMLPKIDLPLFNTNLLSSGEEVHYRPFSIKEEKILLTAKQSGEFGQIMIAIGQILENCVIGIDPTKLPIFDVTHLLLAIRIVSVSNEVEFSIVDDITNEDVKLSLDLNDVSLLHKDGHEKAIKVDDTGATLIMRYPTISEFYHLAQASDEELYKIMVGCMDKLEKDGAVYDLSEVSDDEMNEFVDSLPSTAHMGMRKFFETMPVIRHEIKYKNSNDEDRTFVIEGVDSFFI